METIEINILNPKVKRILKNLAELDLIEINKSTKKSNFIEVLKDLRNHSYEDISLEEIQNEVNEVRASRYEK